MANRKTLRLTEENFKRPKSFRILFFTLTELLIVISIIIILTAILLPALNKARQSVYGIDCTSKLKQIGVANYNYASDNLEYFMPVVYSDSVTGEYKFWYVQFILYKYLSAKSFYCLGNKINLEVSNSGEPLTGYADYDELKKERRTLQGNHRLAGFFYSNGTSLTEGSKITRVMKTSLAVSHSCSAWTAGSPGRYGYVAPSYIKYYDQFDDNMDRYNRPVHGKNWNLLCVDGHVASVNCQDYKTKYMISDIPSNN
ncbi:MAG: hypothetical protein A2017_07785 [Lentisphaerae bacterium GWF2_44_16]|nr:MAG: hypothetical protein A2017_07785 [Lentisphaerae bacterium GWF2_44_16]